MVMAFDHEHERALKRALWLWKVHDTKVIMERGMAVLKKRPNIIDGAMMLDKVNKKHPRKALRSFNKKVVHDQRTNDAAKKLMLINRVDLQRVFDKWAGRDDFPTRFKKAKNMQQSLSLNLRPLKWSFDTIKEFDPNKLKRAARRISFFLAKLPRFHLLLWAARTEKKAHAEDK
jgi:hypothetical protein